MIEVIFIKDTDFYKKGEILELTHTANNWNWFLFPSYNLMLLSEFREQRINSILNDKE